MIDYQRVATALEERQRELGRPWEEIARRAGLSPSTIYLARKGEAKAPSTLRKLDDALDWPPGTLQWVGMGGEAPKEDDLRERVDGLEVQVGRLRSDLVALREKIEEFIEGLTGRA